MCYFLVYGSYSLTPACGHLSTNAGWVTDFICFYMKHLGTRGLGVFCFLRCLIGPILLNNICFRQELFLDWRDVDEICIKITWIVLKRHNIYSSTVLKKKNSVSIRGGSRRPRLNSVLPHGEKKMMLCRLKPWETCLSKHLSPKLIKSRQRHSLARSVRAHLSSDFQLRYCYGIAGWHLVTSVKCPECGVNDQQQSFTEWVM